MNVSELIVRYLQALGVRHVFGYPGDPSVEVLEACRRADLAFVLGRREGTAGLMAEATGMLTGVPGVCLSTLGPGSTNLVNAVANAWLDRVPMLAFSGQIESRREPFFTHQVINQERLFAPVCKWATTIQPHTAATIMRKAVRTAMAERPGPVHMTLAADVVGAEATDAEIRLPPLEAREFPLAFAAEAAAADVSARIRIARRPVILAGIAAVRGNACASLARLAESLGCPVVVAPMAKGVLAEDHPLYAGTLDMACQAFMWKFLSGCDLIIAAGFDAVELIKPWSLEVPTIHVDATPNTDQIYPAELELVGPIAAILDALAASCGGSPRWTDAEVRAHRDALVAKYYEGRVSGRLNPTDVIDVVRRASPREAIATADVGSHKLLVGQGWATYGPRSTLMTNGLSSMGFSLPAAIAAKLVHPKRPVVCFTGDGGLAMVQGELRLASSLAIDPLVIVFCDNSLNRIELKQAQRKYPSWGTLIDSTDIEKLAQSMGCEGANVDSAAALERVLSQPRPSDRPLVLGVHIDPAQYLAQF
ncbi:MAG: thiamine pyrophosphate-binding protein [Betaproteobacteria bacterium]|nr:thiamine pyrophosphate-binding protein [Betaproteobacteria bacterium]